MIATAKPTFAVDAATTRAAAARQPLADLGAEVAGPTALLMSHADVASSHLFVDGPAGQGFDLIVHVCATFCGAGPALDLYEGIDQPILLWAFREPGEVGDRLLFNSLCGANLIGHAAIAALALGLVVGERLARHVSEARARTLIVVVVALGGSIATVAKGLLALS